MILALGKQKQVDLSLRPAEVRIETLSKQYLQTNKLSTLHLWGLFIALMVESRASSCLTYTLVLSDTLTPPIYNIGAISFLMCMHPKNFTALKNIKQV